MTSKAPRVTLQAERATMSKAKPTGTVQRGAARDQRRTTTARHIAVHTARGAPMAPPDALTPPRIAVTARASTAHPSADASAAMPSTVHAVRGAVTAARFAAGARPHRQ